MRKAFQLVRMPATPPTTSSFPAQLSLNKAAAASAVGSDDSARSDSGRAIATAAITNAYQAIAIRMDITNNLPMDANGKSISSADCGMTSKPTNMNGTMTRTDSIPASPPLNNGAALSMSPATTAPDARPSPQRSTTMTTSTCNLAAVRMPRTLITIMAIAASAPVSTQVTLTSQPAIVQRYPLLNPGTRYSSTVGSATASNATTDA